MSRYEHPSRWTAIEPVATKIGCWVQMLNKWLNKAD